MFLQEVKQRKKNLVIGCIDCRKALDMVPYSYVAGNLNTMGIAKNMVSFLGKTMNFWKVKPTCGAETLKEVPIERERFFKGCAISVAVCNYPYTSNTHTENS